MVQITGTRVQGSAVTDVRSDPSEVLSNVNAVCIRILKHEASQTEVGVAKALNYPYPIGNEVIVQAGSVRNHQVCDVGLAGAMILGECQVQLGSFALKDYEADRFAVLERDVHAQDSYIEGDGSGDVTHVNRWGNPPESDILNRTSVGHAAHFDCVFARGSSLTNMGRGGLTCAD